jgi:hypothetical protein
MVSHFLPLVTPTHPRKNHYLGRVEVVLVVEEKQALIHIRCNRVNELYQEVCEQGSTIGYDIEF